MTMDEQQLRDFLHFLTNDGWMPQPDDVQSVLDRYAMAQERNWYPT